MQRSSLGLACSLALDLAVSRHRPRHRRKSAGGVGDVLPHPGFAQNGWVYLSYAEVGKGDTRGGADQAQVECPRQRRAVGAAGRAGVQQRRARRFMHRSRGAGTALTLPPLTSLPHPHRRRR
ncbi:PQQ-dependent sugar dehydrogenase [Xanthomonas sp. WHRI 7945]